MIHSTHHTLLPSAAPCGTLHVEVRLRTDLRPGTAPATPCPLMLWLAMAPALLTTRQPTAPTAELGPPQSPGKLFGWRRGSSTGRPRCHGRGGRAARSSCRCRHARGCHVGRPLEVVKLRIAGQPIRAQEGTPALHCEIRTPRHSGIMLWAPWHYGSVLLSASVPPAQQPALSKPAFSLHPLHPLPHCSQKAVQTGNQLALTPPNPPALCPTCTTKLSLRTTSHVVGSNRKNEPRSNLRQQHHHP